MRFVIFGAGAIGGVIGGRLALAGHEVVLVARGPHLTALQQNGLTLHTPEGTHRPAARAVGTIADAKPGDGDVVVLAVKSQDTERAVADLRAVAGPGITLLCAQNGVENERVALRRFPRVGATCVVLPATHVDPGVVVAHSWPVSGLLDTGLYPGSVDDDLVQLCATFTAAGLDARADPRIMRWKYTKLLSNVGNALDAACGMEARRSDLAKRAWAEAEACYRAAGIEWASRDEDRERRKALSPMREAGGVAHKGTSSWQSLARGTGAIEADWLNGEIVLLGRQHGVPTPVNVMLQEVANRMARDRTPPGSLTLGDLEGRLRDHAG